MKTSLFQTGVLTTLLVCSALDSRAQLFFDFEEGELPSDTTLFGNAILAGDGSGANSCLHLTDPVNSSFGQLRIDNIGDGKSVKEIDIKWRSLIGGGAAGGADGYSLNWATDLPESPGYALPGEAGAGSGLTVTIDTWDNVADELGGAPGIELIWKSNLVAFAPIPKDDPGTGMPFLRRNQFVDAQLTVDKKGLATFVYDGISITAVLDGWKGIQGGDIMLGARTGGANDRHWIDDLQISTGIFSAGVFNGLFQDESSRHDRSGFATLKLSSRGTFSGFLLLAGTRHPLKGAFDLDTLAAKIELPRPGSTTLTVDLELVNKNTVQGSVSDGIWAAALLADRQVWHKKLNPASPYTGIYTTILDQLTSPSVPNGFGYGTASVDAAGKAKFAGILGDGSKVAQKVTVSQKGMWPFYVSAYKGQGSVIGWMRISNQIESSQPVVWTKNPGVPGPLYPNGFLVAPRLYVAPYTPPPKGIRIIDLSSGAAEFGGTDLAAPFASELVLTQDNKIIDLSDNRLAITFATKTGLFKGTVMEPGGGARIKFAGVVYQPEALAAGLVLGLTRSSSVIIRD